MEPREAASVIAQLATAVDFAHQSNVLHRDLKPGNVLLAADGTPKVSDFGLAKLLDLEEGQTRSEEILGTPTYMAPEQALGKADQIGPAVDIYALGVILYEAMTGRPPYRGPDKHATLKLVLKGDLVLPSKHRKGLPLDLEAICVKCLEHHPGRRYSSAGALAADLGRWLKGEPTQARPPRWPARLWRTVKRHKVGALLAMVLAITLAAVYHFDPRRSVREMEAELARGNAVTLISHADSRPWYRILKGQESTQVSTAEDGSFSVHSWDDCLIELLPDPMHDCYRIRAEVRHEKSDLPGWAGIFFGYHRQPTQEGDCHAFLELKFNDLRGISEFFPLLPANIRMAPNIKNQAKKGNQARLGMRFLHPQDKAFEPGNCCLKGPHFQPTGPNPKEMQYRWRQLEVTLTPATISACWEGTSIGEVPCAEVMTDLESVLQANRRHQRYGAVAQSLTPRMEPRGSLGLHVSRSSVSFRNFTILPLRIPASLD